MPVHQSSGCSTPLAGKLTAIFYLRIFAQRHCENAGKNCKINKKKKLLLSKTITSEKSLRFAKIHR